MQFFKPNKWTDDRVLSKAEIPTDPNLPQLSTVLDARTMGCILQDSLPGRFAEGRLRIERCRLVFVRYKPTHYCRVFYTLDISDTTSGWRGIQVMGGKVFAVKPSEDYVASRTKWMKVVPDYGRSFVYLPHHKMILSSFPNDLEIHGLHQLIYPDELEGVVRTGMGLVVIRVDRSEPVKVVSYSPERHCLVRFIVRNSDSPSDKGQRRVVFGKMYHKGKEKLGSQVYRTIVAIWNSEARRSGILSTAEPLGYDPAARVIFQEGVAGTTLTSLVGCKEFLHYVGAAARSLAAIHQTPACMERSRNLDSVLQQMESMAQDLIQVHPRAGERFNRILGRLRDILPGQGQAWSLIHGDFSTNQILVDTNTNRLNVIDFDTVCMGDPHSDLGSFLARLEQRLYDSLRHRVAEEFCCQYEVIHPGVLDRDRLVWHQAVGFVKMALTSIKKLKPGWLRKVYHHLSRAETLLGN